MQLPKRKSIRLKDYDYSTAGAYFVTVCVKDRKAILSHINVGANIVRPKEIHLTAYGKITENAIKNIPNHYPNVTVDKYIIMPDHFHILLQIHTDTENPTAFTPAVDRIIKQTKGYITKQLGFSIWQKSFNDHIIRGKEDYKNIWEYIENNPLK